jgi:hypothetical protein
MIDGRIAYMRSKTLRFSLCYLALNLIVLVVAAGSAGLALGGFFPAFIARVAAVFALLLELPFGIAVPALLDRGIPFVGYFGIGMNAVFWGWLFAHWRDGADKPNTRQCI